MEKKKIEIKLSNDTKEKIKENLIIINQSKEFLDQFNEETIKSSFDKSLDQINKNIDNEIEENSLLVFDNLNEYQLQKIYDQRPDLKPKEIPLLKQVKLINPPTLDQTIVSYLEKYEIFIQPSNVGEWNGWDILGTVTGIFSPQNSTRALASSLFYMNRSNQINTAAQEWSTWKRWALEQKDFSSFKVELLEQTEKYNEELLEETRRAIQIAKEHNERVYKENTAPRNKKRIFPRIRINQIIIFDQYLLSLVLE